MFGIIAPLRWCYQRLANVAPERESTYKCIKHTRMLIQDVFREHVYRTLKSRTKNGSF